MAKTRIGVYPGTFDPITNGHLDIILRSAKILDKVVVAVAVNAGKGPMFPVAERIDLVRAEVAELPALADKVTVRDFDNLLVELAAEEGANIIIRGLRAVSDFDYEFQMASMNAKLDGNIETVCLMASDRHHFIASRLVKEIAMMGGDVNQFVSPRVSSRLVERCAELR